PLHLPFSGAYLPAWLANVLLWFGLFSLAKDRWDRARIAAWLCVALASSALVAASRGAHWLKPLVGYYGWLVSMLAFLIGVEAVGLSDCWPFAKTRHRRSERGTGEDHRG